MYKKLLTLLFVLPFLMIGFIQKSFSNKNNPPAAQTGALTQASCGFSNSTNTCHGSTNNQPLSTLVALNTDVKLFSGATEMTSSTFKYKPDSIYSFTLKLVSSPTNLNGFSLTAENNGNIMSNSFSIPAGSNARLNTQNSDYVNQDGSDNINEWTFNWTAPASQNGDVTFYATINRTNNNGQWSGDEIIPFKLEIAEQSSTTSPTSIARLDLENEIAIKGNPILNNTLSFDLMVKEPKQYSVQIFDLSGKIIHTETRTYHAGLKTFNINFEEKGVFILNIRTNQNEAAQFKIIN